MKTFLLSTLALVAAICPAYAITVTTPANGAKVTSPFRLVASSEICDSKPAVSMGYSIDHGSATIVPISFSAMVVASEGKHILHVKCWAKKADADVLLNITVIPGSTTPPSTAATPAFSPGAGAYKSAQSVTISVATPGATIYYTTNGSAPTTSSPRYSGSIPVDTSEVIEAVAVASGYAKSGLARGDYVITPPSSTGPAVPSNAINSSGIQLLDSWHFNHDAGTPGTATGKTSLVSSPSVSGSAREFNSSYTGSGGEIYSVTYADDVVSTQFVYDGWVWIAPGSKIANLEMDSNQVISNGDTIIYAFQCNGYAKVWDYSGAGAHWVHSTQPCDVSTWSTDAWHHVQISYSRDDSGYVTYHSVWLDSVEQKINATVPSSFALGWKVGVVQTQFQMDGLGASGSSLDYLDSLTISRW
jgi:hypothetical protein